MRTCWRTRIGVKLIGATLLFLGTVALLSTWLTVDNLREVLGEQAEAQGRSLARSASIFSVEPLLIEDYPVLETYVEQMVEAKNDVAFVRVYRADGRLAAQASTSTLESSAVTAFEADVRVLSRRPERRGTCTDRCFDRPVRCTGALLLSGYGHNIRVRIPCSWTPHVRAATLDGAAPAQES